MRRNIDFSPFSFFRSSLLAPLPSPKIVVAAKGMPMNQMPCLQVDGKRVNQSLACCRYLSRELGLAGSSDWENLQIDTIADTVNDFRLSMKRFWKLLKRNFNWISDPEIAVVSYEPDDDVKDKKLVTLNSEVIPFYLEKLEDIARDNNGHLACGKVDKSDRPPWASHSKPFPLLSAHMGRLLLCRHHRLSQLLGQARSHGQLRELASRRRQRHHPRWRAELDQRATSNWDLGRANSKIFYIF